MKMTERTGGNMARRDLRKTFYLNTRQADLLQLDSRACVSWGIEVYYIGTGYPCGIHILRNGHRVDRGNLDGADVESAIKVIPGLWNKLTKAELKEYDRNPVTRRAK